MIRCFGFCLMRAEELTRLLAEARIQACRAPLATIAALQAENARLTAAVAAHETTIAALSAKSARTARKKPAARESERN